jgi:thioredoxin-like negative regulator of GroEL
MAAEYDRRWRFVAINADRHPSVAQEFQVSALPTWSGFEMADSAAPEPDRHDRHRA